MLTYDFFHKVTAYGNESWRGKFSGEEITSGAYEYFLDYLAVKNGEKLENTSIAGLLQNFQEDLPNPEAEHYLTTITQNL